MAAERTFAMIKPDAVSAGNANAILAMIEADGFTVLGKKETTIDKQTAERFYAVHKERPFFSELVEFVTSGPVILLALEKEGAIAEWRTLMGATNPAEAAEGTVRKLYGTDIGSNAAHGSDAPETAQYELGIFFPEFAN